MTSSADKEALSDYEIARLERIRANKARLRALGLAGGDRSSSFSSASSAAASGGDEKGDDGSSSSEGGAAAMPTAVAQNEAVKRRQKKRKRQEAARKAAKQAAAASAPHTGSRRSKRLRGEVPDGGHKEINQSLEVASAAVPSSLVTYRLPRDPDELDDGEFTVYCALKRYRLKEARRIAEPAYKVW